MRVLLVVALISTVACGSNAPRLDADLRAIEALNQHDIDAVMSSDVDALISQWTDDFVVIGAAGIVRGRAANAELMEPAREMPSRVEPVEHVLDFEEVIVAGDYAIQWGTVRSKSRSLATGEEFEGRSNLMRILQRQGDGSWKMHRTMTVRDATLQ